MDGDDDFDTSNVGSGSTAGSRIDITTATETMSNRYQTQLVFSTLSSSMDSGSYECSIGINSNDSLLYVNDSALVNESTTVSVQGMELQLLPCVCYFMLPHCVIFYRPSHQ